MGTTKEEPVVRLAWLAFALASGTVRVIAAQSEWYSYGSAKDLSGVWTIRVHTGTDLKARKQILDRLKDDLPFVEVAESPAPAQVLLVFGSSVSTMEGSISTGSSQGSMSCQTFGGRGRFSPPATTRCESSGSSGGWTIPVQRSIKEGQGLVVALPDSGKPLLVLDFGDTKGNRFQRDPAVNFARAFVKLYREANPWHRDRAAADSARPARRPPARRPTGSSIVPPLLRRHTGAEPCRPEKPSP